MFLVDVKMGLEYTCGSIGDLSFSGTFPYLVSYAVLIIKIAIPIILIIFGMLDLGKAVMASKEDEIKKGQQTFIKRLVAAVLVFFVIQIVQIVVKFVSSNDTSISNCFNCFINGSVSETSCISSN